VFHHPSVVPVLWPQLEEDSKEVNSSEENMADVVSIEQV